MCILVHLSPRRPLKSTEDIFKYLNYHFYFKRHCECTYNLPNINIH